MAQSPKHPDRLSGLAYKAYVDDLRESPALFIVQALAQKYHGRIAVVEPHIESLPDSLQGQSVVLTGLQKAFDWADVIVALVGHKQIKSICLDHYDDACIVDAAGIRKNEA